MWSACSCDENKTIIGLKFFGCYFKSATIMDENKTIIGLKSIKSSPHTINITIDENKTIIGLKFYSVFCCFRCCTWWK